MSSYTRLIRFISPSSPTPLIGEPVDANLDVGIASYESRPIEVELFSGRSVVSPGERTGKREVVERLLSPLSQEEVGTVRCIGLNYLKHAQEANLEVPETPTLFLKTSNAIGDPYPAPTVLPRAFVKDNAADFEAEVAIVIGKKVKDVSEDEALDYVLGFTASNDVSSRIAQFQTSQWSYSKSFDGALPLGPAFVHIDAVKDLKEVKIKGVLNGNTVQDSGLE